ncbi:MAG: hypothetical protein LUG85_02840 [Clostridiales bacterium]|nr:hypothetical protein [Clostridiales bacterium]MCD7827457.1 hypothetical protein [Clostridiales bacterium]
MTKALKKILAVILSLTMLSTIGLVAVYAEDADETTTAASEETAEETEETSAAEENLNFFERIIQFIYDFLEFLHEQYLTFVVGDDGTDVFAWMFEGDYLSLLDYDY